MDSRRNRITPSVAAALTREQKRRTGAVGVLVIDDDADVRAWLREALERADYHIDVAASGAQGLAMAASRPYDVLVVDQKLPDLAGLDLLQALSDSGLRVPTVFITGYGVDGFRDAAVALGAAACLDKRIRPSALLNAVERALRASPSWPAGTALFRQTDGRLRVSPAVSHRP